MSCCTSGLDDLFTEKLARHDAKRYRKRGLTKRARKLVAAIQHVMVVADKRVLEIGVGVGAVTIELLREGAASATGVDAVAAQLEQARALAAEKGVADRLDLVLADFTATTNIAHADLVLLDRVVCCYPDWRGLLSAAASHTQHALAMTYPRDVWWMRLIWRLGNWWQVLSRSEFRLYIHSPRAMHAVLREQGLTPRIAGKYFGWDILVAPREAVP
jgi:magnesium-protoporphyrin O-methyltransferase